MVKVSAIIISYNNSHNLNQCLNSLISQNYDRNIIDLEIIVVDSGSIDNSIKILEKYKDKIKVILKPIYLPRLSPATARNIGVQNSKGDILIFSDSDCIVPLSWVKDIVNSFENYQVDCIIGSREPDIGKGLGTFIRRYDFIIYSNKFSISNNIIINNKTLKRGIPFVLLSGNNFAIKKEVWNKIGGMKTVFERPTGEDIMLEVELIKNGYNILFNPKNKVIHIHSISFIETFKKVFPRSEAIYLLSKYSNRFINWRHFAERGHVLNLKYFWGSILFIILILLITSLFNNIIPLTVLILFIVILLIIVYRLIKINGRLELILNSKGGNYKKTYKISLLKLFYFNQIHFFLKSVALLNFLWCIVVKNKYASFKRIIND